MTNLKRQTSARENDPGGSIFLLEDTTIIEDREFGDRFFALLQRRGDGADTTPEQQWAMYQELLARSLAHLAIDTTVDTASK